MAKIAVLGAGISGLTAAFYLKKAGHEVTVFEKSDTVGGLMQSVNVDGYNLELGPNTVAYSKPELIQLIDDLGLIDELIFPGEKAKARYILKKGNLVALPSGPKDFFSTKAISFGGKMRVIRERYIKAAKEQNNESLADFAIRRFGKEAYDNFFIPFVSGVFAGDPTKLSAQYAFPSLYNLEKEYGSIIGGMMKEAKKKKGEKNKTQKKGIFSFKEGLKRIPKVLYEQLKSEVILGAEVVNFIKENKGFTLNYNINNQVKTDSFDKIVSTLPAYILSQWVKNDTLSKSLDAVFYAPICSIHIAYKNEAIFKPYAGFGFLIPGFEKSPLLGVLFNSQMFENAAPEGTQLFTVMIGGARFSSLTEMDEEELIDVTKAELEKVFQIDVEPVFTHFSCKKKAIPQYDLAHFDLKKEIEKFEQENEGFYIRGNFINGISVPDCIKSGKEVAELIVSKP